MLRIRHFCIVCPHKENGASSWGSSETRHESGLSLLCDIFTGEIFYVVDQLLYRNLDGHVNSERPNHDCVIDSTQDSILRCNNHAC